MKFSKSLMFFCTCVSASCSGLQKKEPDIIPSIAAWGSLSALTVSGGFLAYKALGSSVDAVFSRLPLINRQHEYLSTVVSRSAMAPLLALWSLRYSKLAWYFFYVFYSGEHISPQLAYDAMNDLKIYVQHLNTIKEVQKELNAVVVEINQAVNELESVQETETSRRTCKRAIDPDLMAKLNELIVSNEAHVAEIIAQLREIMPNNSELEAVIAAILQSSGQVAPAQRAGSFLHEQAQAVVAHIQAGAKDLGYDAQVLNDLVKNLIEYWQKYTIGLAVSIDTVLQRCHAVHAIEQFIVTTLDVPLNLV